MAYTSINPANNELLKEIPRITEKELEDKLVHSRKGFERWSAMKMEERIDLILRLKEVLVGNNEYHARLMSLEMGKPLTQAIAEVKK